MKSQELRIGNLVRLKSDGRIEAVREVLSSLVSINASPVLMNTKVISTPVSNIEPIQLTEEWLLKFGFEKYGDEKEYRYYCPNDDYYIEGMMLKTEEVGLTNLSHVHQLQNLYFALTGQELTIKD